MCCVEVDMVRPKFRLWVQAISTRGFHRGPYVTKAWISLQSEWPIHSLLACSLKSPFREACRKGFALFRFESGVDR